MTLSPVWRAEIDALEFRVADAFRFVVHRNVFRTLLGRTVSPAECISYAERQGEAFLAAAGARREAAAPGTTAFHLNSRQLRRAMGTLPVREGVREPAPR